MIGCENNGKRTDEKSCQLHDNLVEIPEKYPQGRCSEVSNNLCKQKQP